MALLMGLTRAVSSSAVFTKLLHHRAAVAPVPRRLFSSSIPSIDSSEDNCTINANGGSFTRSEAFHVQRAICDQYMDNPFQISGPRGAYEAKKVDEGLFVRMEMPGIEKDEVKIWVEYGNVYVQGEGRKESRYEDSGRAYSGSIELSSNVFHPEKIKADLRNGVLRMVIPKARNYEETMKGVFEVLVGCGIQPDLSDREPLWRRGLPSKSRASQSSNPPRREWSIVGDYILGHRQYSFLDPPDQQSSGLYPFQLGGPMESLQMKMLEGERLFMRVDMPDVPSQGLSVKTRDSKVFWGGEGVKGSEHDEETRGYFGSNTQNCGCCNYAVLKSEVKYGVFRILIQLEKFKTARCSASATARKH